MSECKMKDSFEGTNEQSPSKHIIQSESTNDLIKDESSLCILPARIVYVDSHELVAKLCKYIMSIDDVKCLEKEWVPSSRVMEWLHRNWLLLVLWCHGTENSSINQFLGMATN